MNLLDGVKAGATLSPCGTYRYALFRDWFPKSGKGHVLWVMLNPSTATADEDDPTVRRCQGFAREWGYDGITVVNLFALRSTDPKGLHSHPEPVGEANDAILAGLAGTAATGLVVAAWGDHGMYRNRAWKVAQALRSVADVHCLGLTKARNPRHPLYIPSGAQPLTWKAKSA